MANGFEPVGSLGGRPFNAPSSRYWITSTYDTDIVYGQPVAMRDDLGTIAALDVTPVAASLGLGIFLGCSYLNSEGQRIHAMKWPANTASAGAWAYVADDPHGVFRVKITNGSSEDATATIDVIGSNCVSDVNDKELGTSGRSGVGVASFADTATLGWRVVGLTNDKLTVDSAGSYEDFVSTTTTTFTHALVKWNAGVHFYDQGLGSAVS